jgi:tetratricopeptide (TPR) repeat protein
LINAVLVSFYLCTDPNPKIKDDEEKMEQGTIMLSRKKSNSGKSITLTEPGIGSVDGAYLLYLNKDYTGALDKFEKIVENYPDNLSGNLSLVFMERCLKELGRESEIFDKLNSVSQNKAGNSILTFAESRKVYQYMKQGKYTEAIEQSKSVLNVTKDTLLEKMCLYDLGGLYWEKLGDKVAGESYYRKLIEKYPYDILSEMSLLAMGETVSKDEKVDEKTSSSSEASINVLDQNYPNPFNPTTQITYSVPKDGKVKLSIYDVLGKEVNTIINEYKVAGTYQAQFNGSRLSSGTYFYRLSIMPLSGEKEIVQQKIMQMIK